MHCSPPLLRRPGLHRDSIVCRYPAGRPNPAVAARATRAAVEVFRSHDSIVRDTFCDAVTRLARQKRSLPVRALPLEVYYPVRLVVPGERGAGVSRNDCPFKRSSVAAMWLDADGSRAAAGDHPPRRVP